MSFLETVSTVIATQKKKQHRLWVRNWPRNPRPVGILYRWGIVCHKLLNLGSGLVSSLWFNFFPQTVSTTVYTTCPLSSYYYYYYYYYYYTPCPPAWPTVFPCPVGYLYHPFCQVRHMEERLSHALATNLGCETAR